MEYLAHYGPSLCVKFHEKLVYAAYGPWIYVYDYRIGELKNKCRLFHKDKVHGISISKTGAMLVFGARSFSVINLEQVQNCCSLAEHEKTIKEWIISGEFNISANGIFLLTSYNKVIITDLSGNPITTKAIYGEKSILYSGSITICSQDRVLINAGTVMGGVIIWDLFKQEIIHNLKGHAGSIFYVTISEDRKYVASCSDDRSIMLWDLKTGDLLDIGWGHTARIWNLKFFDSSTKLISVSEDCTCRVWGIIEKDDSNKLSLTQENIYEVHLSKNVWGVDVEENQMVAVTSGNDGRLKLTDLKQPSRLENQKECFTLKEIASDCGISFQKDEIIKGFHWFHFGLVALTSKGNFLSYSDLERSWRFLFSDTKFNSYSSTHGISSENVVVFANNKSDLLFLRFGPDGKEILAEARKHIQELSKTNNCMIRQDSPTSFLIVLESPNPRDDLVCLKVNLESLEQEELHVLDKPESFVSTCMEVYDSFILIGSRFSTLAVFDLSNNNRQPYVIRRLTPGDTTTSIKYMESCKDSQVFSVTNRDGYYNIIKIKLNRDLHSQGPSHQVIHSNKIVRGFLEDANFNKNGDYITCGFKSSLFYIYNESACYEIASNVCGGAHRQWKLNEDGEDSILIYIKASTLFFQRFVKPSVPDTLCKGLHGREIRDITIQKNKKYKGGYLFCTGSEDTTIKLSHVDGRNGKLTTYWTQRKHVSGLQRCCFLNDKLMISSSAREELFLWELNTEGDSRPYLMLRQALPTSSSNPDLRIMDFDVTFIEGGQDFILATVYSDSAIKIWFYSNENNSFHLIIEGRYKTCCLLNVFLSMIKDQVYLVTSATDGHLMFYNITEHTPFAVTKNDDTLVYSHFNISTVALPDFECRLRVHQSGIKTMTYHVDDRNTLFIYTGGDDNALGMSIAEFDQTDSKINARVVDLNPQAASSTITSCNLLFGANKLLTTSVDQIIRLWDVSSGKLVLINSEYTTIADTGSSDAIDIDDSSCLVLAGGVGLSVLKVRA